MNVEFLTISINAHRVSIFSFQKLSGITNIMFLYLKTVKFLRGDTLQRHVEISYFGLYLVPKYFISYSLDFI